MLRCSGPLPLRVPRALRVRSANALIPPLRHMQLRHMSLHVALRQGIRCSQQENPAPPNAWQGLGCSDMPGGQRPTRRRFLTAAHNPSSATLSTLGGSGTEEGFVHTVLVVQAAGSPDCA